jgi:hypothetical protein
MYELNGKQYSLEEIQAAADQSKMSLQDYIIKANIKILDTVKQDFQTPTTPGAVVEETAAPDTESKSENISSESAEKFNLVNTALGALFTGIKDTNAGQVVMRAAQTPVSLYASIGRMYNDAVDEFGTASAETGLRFLTDGIQLFKPDFTEEEQDALINKVSETMFEPFFETIGAKKITEQISDVKKYLIKQHLLTLTKLLQKNLHQEILMMLFKN